MRIRCTMATAALLFALPLYAQIYRCESGGTVAFSDRPCGPDSALHTPRGKVSYVAPDENLPAIAEATQAFLRERRARAAQRRAARQADSSPAPGSTHTTVETVFLPWPSPSARHHRHLWDRTRHGDDPAPPVIAGNDRYSPLNGPILGTRRNSAAFNKRSRAERRPDETQ